MNPSYPTRPIPGWLASIEANVESDIHYATLPLAEILEGSVFYPASSDDGRPIETWAGHIHSFVYVDYFFTPELLDEKLFQNGSGFHGYERLFSTDVTRELGRELLGPDGQTIDTEQAARRHGLKINEEERAQLSDLWQNGWAKPFHAKWCVFKRRLGFDDSHGPERFSILFIVAEALGVYLKLYHEHHVRPEALAIGNSGYSFGGNWTCFEDPGRVFAEAVRLNGSGLPKYLMLEKREPGWPEYEKVQGVTTDDVGVVWKLKPRFEKNQTQVPAALPFINLIDKKYRPTSGDPT